MPMPVMSEYDLHFLPIPNEVHVILDEQHPPVELTTSALGLVFQEDRLLMPKLVERGWDVPGGHIEAGETPGQTFRREVYEETGAHLSKVGLLGYQKFVIHAPKPDGYKYPYPVSYQAFFWGVVSSLKPFEPTFEVSERGFFLPAEARKLDWVQKFEPLYQAALDRTYMDQVQC